MNGEPLVSIIIPTYRREKELERALNSVKNQEYRNFEIILIDDNDHPDWNKKVENIVVKFQVENEEIHFKYLVNHPNMGSARTRNIGIKEANGQYICFLDDDDLYLSGRITNQLIPMLKSDADYSITDLVLYHEDERVAEIRKRNYIKETTSDKLFQYHLMYHMTGTDTLMFKKEYLEKIGGFDAIDVGDEFYLMSKAILKGGKILYVPTCDVKAYVHSAGGGLSSGDAKVDGENRLYEYKKKYFEKLDNAAKRYIKMRHHMVLGFAYLKEKKWCGFIKEGICAVLIDCRSCLSVVKNRKN